MGSEAFSVEILPRSEWPVWESLAERSPQANPFARVEWLDPLAQATGAEIEISLCRRGQEPVAGFAAFVYGGPLGRLARLAPSAPYNSVAILPRECREPHRAERHELDVLRAIRQHVGARYDYVRFVHHPALRDVRAFEWDEWRTAVFYTHRLRFGAGSDPIGGIASDVRRRASQAARAGITVAMEQDAEAFYSLLGLTYERHGLPVQQLPREAYLRICRALLAQGLLEVWLARSPDGEPLAGSVIVRQAASAYLWLAAADPTRFDSGANQLLTVEMICDLSARVELLDLCGSFPPAVAQYKSTSGGELTPYYTVWKANGRLARCATAAKELLVGLGLRPGGYW